MLSLLLVIGFVALNILAYNHAKSMMVFTDHGDRTRRPEALTGFVKLKVLLSGINVPRPAASLSPSDFAEGGRVLTINASDGITLEAWYYNQGETTPLVILFHGYVADKTALLAEAQALLDLGSSILLVDFRGSGGSSESYTTVGIHEADDVVAVTTFAKDNFSHAATLLYGQSMGATAILKAIHDDGLEVDAVILEAVFDTLLNAVRNRFHAMRVPSFPLAELLVFWGGRQQGVDAFAHRPVDDATALHHPALFMHGRDDPRATLEEGRRVFDAVPGTKTLVIFDKVAHESGFNTHPRQWREAVAEIIRTAVNHAENARIEPHHP